VPAVVGQLAIRQYVAGAFATPGFSISWNTDQIVVSKSGDMAFSTGTNQISLPGPDGKPVVSENRTVVIWKKQSDGSWKCLLDVFTPAPAATSK
jgi:ketosteroid isomerase-like protein